MTSRNKGTRRTLAMAALVGIVLSACGAQPGAAAVIDDRTVSENYLADAVTDYRELLGQPIAPKDMLATLIIVPTLVETGADHGIGVSRSEASQLLEMQAEMSGQEIPAEGYSEGLIDIAQMQLVNSQISQSPQAGAILDDFWQTIENSDIEVNPRYGSFEFDDVAGPQIAAPSLPWLTEPATPPLG